MRHIDPTLATHVLPILTKVLHSDFLDHGNRVELGQELATAQSIEECDAILVRFRVAFQRGELVDLIMGEAA